MPPQTETKDTPKRKSGSRGKRLAISVPTIAILVGILCMTIWPQIESLRGGSENPLTDSEHVRALKTAMEKLRPLHKKLGKPGPVDWLTFHDEPGQTFDEYLHFRPVTPNGKRRAICIQPLGDFTRTQRRIVDLTAQFMGLYFSRPVTVAADLPLSIIPNRARREHPAWHVKQILTTYVLDKVLRPRLPKDAAVYLALTTSDLYPAEDWNFVFGQASLRERVGVWSIYRNGDPDESEAGFRLCLLRTIKTATHETGHMFSMQHCTAYECNMCGSNSRAESDRRPLALCPECLAKVCWATGADPVARYRKLAAFAKENGLEAQETAYRKALDALGDAGR